MICKRHKKYRCQKLEQKFFLANESKISDYKQKEKPSTDSREANFGRAKYKQSCDTYAKLKNKFIKNRVCKSNNFGLYY